MSRLALRPSVLVSVVLHAGVVVGVGVGGGRGVADRDAVVLAFEQVERGAELDAVEVPVADARPDDPRIEEPVVVEPRPAEPPLPPVDPAFAPDPFLVPEAPVPDADARPAPAPSPTTPTRPRRAASDVAPTTAVAAVPPAAPPSAPSRVGAAQVTTFATAQPTNRPPSYPDVALRAGWQGVVWLLVDVGPDGRVASLAIERSSGYEVLDAAAVDAVRAWTYAPRLVDGVPTLDRLRLPVRFAPRTVAPVDGAASR